MYFYNVYLLHHIYSIITVLLVFNLKPIHPNRRLPRRQITLSKQSDLPLSKRPNNRMQHATVMEKHQIPLFPIMRVHKPRTNCRALQFIHDIPHALEVVNDRPISRMDLAHGSRVDL